MLSSSSVAPPLPDGQQSPAVGVLLPAVQIRVCSQSRIGGVADEAVVVGSSPSGPGMSQTSQAHAHRRGVDMCRNTPPGGLVRPTPNARGMDMTRSTAPPSILSILSRPGRHEASVRGVASVP